MKRKANALFFGIVLILFLSLIVFIIIFNISQYEPPNKIQNQTNISLLTQEDYFSKVTSPHWTHMPLTYSIDSDCKEIQESRIINAMNIISDNINSITFEEESSEPDILFSCSYIEDCYEAQTGYICPHETSRVTLTKANNNWIARAKIEFFGLKGFFEEGKSSVSGFVINSCGPLNKEIQSILLAFDYEQNENPKSILFNQENFYFGKDYYEEEDCKEMKEIDEGIIKDLEIKYNR